MNLFRTFTSYFFLTAVLHSFCFASPFNASNINASYINGQVFITWENASDTNLYYNVYRSTVPITSPDQLPACENLGYTGFHSAKDHQLSKHDGLDEYYSIDSGKSFLMPNTGLFVATTLSEGSYYYAITTLNHGVEDKAIIPGINSLSVPVVEKVSKLQPVFQQNRMIQNNVVSIYTIFTSMKYATGVPLMNKTGYIATDFAVVTNKSTGNQPLRIKFHAGGSDFLFTGVEPILNEVLLTPEDYLPSGNNSAWWGSNENFDFENDANNTHPPTSGIDYNYMHQTFNNIIDWAITALPIDSNRIYLEGSSFGAIGAFFYAITYPERIAAVKLTVGCFNLAFQNDSNKVCSLNTGNGNRITGDNRMGTVSRNLNTNLGYPIYDFLNGGWMAHHFDEKDYPVFYSVNGKRDSMVGWTEKTMFYDSVNTYHFGGYFFYDNRTHSGNGATWNEANFDLYRYHKNVSYPAFSNCSANEDYGNGSAKTGASFGTINGFLDWNDQVTDTNNEWSATVFLRNLVESSGAIYPAPSSCTVDITPRRLQHFKPAEGDEIYWNVMHQNSVIQSGSLYYAGGLITIPAVTVFDDSVKITLSNQTIQDSIGFSSNSIIAYPNPFTSTVNIRWELAADGNCTVEIFDVQGRQISLLSNGWQTAGVHQVSWKGVNETGAPLCNGVYFVRLAANGTTETRKIVFQR